VTSPLLFPSSELQHPTHPQSPPQILPLAKHSQ